MVYPQNAVVVMRSVAANDLKRTVEHVHSDKVAVVIGPAS